jgi:hypothetical protein
MLESLPWQILTPSHHIFSTMQAVVRPPPSMNLIQLDFFPTGDKIVRQERMPLHK